MSEPADATSDATTETTTGATTGTALGILELADVCTTMQARCRDAFEQLGQWVTSDAATSSDGRVRRALAAAAHRHAAHVDLWAARSPTIPVAVAVPPIDTTLTEVDDAGPADVLAAYAMWRGALERDLADLAARVDPELDPSTADVIARVRFDLDRTAAALP